MKAMAARPLMCICLAYLAVLVCMLLFPGTPGLGVGICIAGAGLGAAGFLLRTMKPHRFLWLGIAAAVCFAVWRGGNFNDRLVMWKCAAGADSELYGTVETLDYATDRGAQMTVSTLSLNGVSCRMKLLLESDDSSYAAPGERIRCGITVLSEEETGRTAEELRYDRSKGIVGTARITGSSMETERGGFSLSAGLMRIRDACRIRIFSLLPQTEGYEHAAGFVSGLLLGDKASVPASVKRDFRRIGLSHMLAVSGLHLSVMLACMDRFLLTFGTDRRYRLIPEFLLILLIMGVTGFSPSVCRAGIMWGLYLLSYYAQGERDGYTALFLAAALICVVRPYAALDVGLILSVCSVFGIQFLGMPLIRSVGEHMPRTGGFRLLRNRIVTPLIITLSALTAVLPVSLFVFGEISLIAPLANLILSLPVSAVLLTAPVMLVLSFLPGLRTAAWLLSFPVRWITAILLRVAELLASADGILVGVRHPFLLPVVLLTVGIGVVLVGKFRSRMAVFPSCLCGILLFALCMQVESAVYADSVRVLYHVKNRNESVAITAESAALLIDCSDGAFNQSYESWEHLQTYGITELDAVLLTHYHEKHRYLLHRLSETVMIGKLLLPEPETAEEREMFGTFSADPVIAAIGVECYRRGEDAIRIGNAEITVFPPAYLRRSVQPLLGFTVSVGDTVMTCLSSAAWEYENDPAAADYADFRDAALAETDLLLCGVHGPTPRFSGNGTDMPEGPGFALPSEGGGYQTVMTDGNPFSVFRLTPGGFRAEPAEN